MEKPDPKTTTDNPATDTPATIRALLEKAHEDRIEIERLRAEVICYEKMLTRFEDAFTEQKRQSRGGAK